MSKPFCPMCGEPVKVVGKTTFHYESVASVEIASLRSALEKARSFVAGYRVGSEKELEWVDAALQGGSDHVKE